MSLFIFPIKSIKVAKMNIVVHNFLNDARKLVDDKQDDTEKIAAFRKFCQDNIVIFSVIENFFNKFFFNRY